ncbi:MAG: hypothetical protein ABIG84_07480 [archaeon]
MEIFGISIELLNVIFYFCVVLVLYFIVLEFEFREIRSLTKGLDSEEMQFEKEVRELREEIARLTKIVT